MEDIKSILSAATKLARQGDNDAAAEKFLEAVEYASEDPRGWFGLGVCCARSEKFEEARDALQEAKRLGHPRANKALKKLAITEKASAGETGSDESETKTAPDAAKEMSVTSTKEQTTARKRKGAEKKKAAKKAAEEKPVAPEDKIDLGKRVRVMLIEDKASDREGITQQLRNYMKNVEIVETPFAESASRTILNMGIFDVAIMDWDTSPHDAKNLLDFMKLRQPHIPVIVLTEDWDGEMAREVIQAGADYCMIKAPGYFSVMPFVIEQKFEQSYALQEEVETEMTDVAKGGRRKYLDTIAQPILLTNHEGKVVDINLAGADELRVTRDRLVDEACEDLFGGEDGEEPFFPLQEAFSTGEPATRRSYSTELEKRYLVQTFPVKEEEGSEYLHLLTDLDAGDLAQEGEGRAGAGESVLATGLQEIETPLVSTDGEGELLYANKAFGELVGVPDEDLVGQTAEDVMPEDFYRDWQDWSRRALGSGAEMVTEKMIDSRWYACYMLATGEEENGGNVVGLFVDVSEKKMAGASDSAGLFRELEEFAGGIAFELDQEGMVKYLSQSGRDLTGKGKDGFNFADILSGEMGEKWEELKERVLKAGENVESEELALQDNNSNECRGQISLTPIVGKGPGEIEGLCGIWRENTAQQKLEQILQIIQE
ncbi:MAG: PAS domain-containing protein [Planctomycetes bacterium]|nr:PAS domain-containing protein [Planctomycetota bacterium]